MKKFLSIFFLISILFSNAYSQSKLYMPKEFTKSIKDGYRSWNGTPGKNYFINYSRYKINANFNPTENKLTGTETVIYINNSPDTLKRIVVKLNQNIYKKGTPKDFEIPEADLNEGVIIKELKIRQKSIDVTKLATYSTFLFLPLKESLLPGDSIELYFSWETKFPEKRPIRIGKYNKKTFMVAYWYPQIAVYDDLFGWDNKSYTGIQEFYNDHADYDVNITVPSPNLVWATGILQNPEKVLNKKYYERYKQALHSKEVVKIVTAEDLKEGDILKNTKQNSWHFVAKQVPDFAFATSDIHNWDAVSISIPDKVEPVIISAVYADSAEIYHTLAESSRKIISYYSFQKPQIFFPYPAITVFEGGGGMEYPMMVNIGYMPKPCTFYYVVGHEIGHSYFPFYTGTNENRFAWMDEGLISYLPCLATDAIWDKCTEIDMINTRYSRIAGTINDVPIMMPSNFYHDFYAYRNIAYNRPGFAFYILNQTLGDSLFFASLREYTKRWAHKHPDPYDFLFTFNDVTKQNLEWFWKPYFFEFAAPDLEISDYNYNNADLFIRIKNKGGIPLPVQLKIILEDGKVVKYSKKADCWKDTDHIDISLSLETKPVKIILGKDNIPDIDLSNNTVKL